MSQMIKFISSALLCTYLLWGDRANVDTDILKGKERLTLVEDIPYAATLPKPANVFNAVSLPLKTLSWKASRFAVKQRLHFGLKREDVANGRKSLSVDLSGAIERFSLPDSIRIEYGTTYYWRVSTDNGSLGEESGTIWSFRTKDSITKEDITFFVSSDTHYGRSDNGYLNQLTIDMMNSAPGMELPSAFGGGRVATPRGVVLNGDLLDNGTNAEADKYWKQFEADYGLNGSDGRLAYPVYEGFGNHDGGPATSVSRKAIRERNKDRVGLTAVSKNGLHYSWDWDDVHLVQLNIFGGDGPQDVMNVPGPSHDPELALAFLKEDLNKNVGRTGKKVILLQHFGWVGGMSTWWTPEAKERYFQAIKSFNVIALINGHSHGAEFIPWKDFLTIHNGATTRPETGKGDFMIVRIKNNELSVIQKKRDSWGIMIRQPLNASQKSISSQKTP